MARLTLSDAWLSDFCLKHSVRRLSLFGSVLRDDFGPDSDVDVLVEYVDGAAVGYFEMMRMQRELSDRLGLRVDLRTPAELSRHIRDRVLAEAEVRYVHR